MTEESAVARFKKWSTATLGLLASPSDLQVAHLRGMRVGVDELLLDLDDLEHFARALVARGEISSRDLDIIHVATEPMSALTGPPSAVMWQEGALAVAPEWNALRSAARRSLQELEEAWRRDSRLAAEVNRAWENADDRDAPDDAEWKRFRRRTLFVLQMLARPATEQAQDSHGNGLSPALLLRWVKDLSREADVRFDVGDLTHEHLRALKAVEDSADAVAAVVADSDWSEKALATAPECVALRNIASQTWSWLGEAWALDWWD